jgi:uncharacterized YigZ family protein
MEVYSFRTIEGSIDGNYKELGSKFLAFAFPVESEVEIKEQLDVLRKKYFDARHHCYAWVLGADKSRYRSSDDGEPNHSAGDPILGQIRSRDITNVLVIVVRYFGGVKLGVGGLIQAYKAATDDALSKAVIIEKEVMRSFLLRYPYHETAEVQRLVKEFELKIVKQEFLESCSLMGEVRLKHANSLLVKIELLQATHHNIMLESIS